MGNDDATRTLLAAQTLVGIHRIGLAVLHFENLSRTGIYALFVTGTFVVIYNDFPHDMTSIKNKLRLKIMVLFNLVVKAKQNAIIEFL